MFTVATFATVICCARYIRVLRGRQVPTNSRVTNVRHIDTKDFYNGVYRVDGADYGEAQRFDEPSPHLNLIGSYLQRFKIRSSQKVLEVGCGLGKLHTCHPNWQGIEYSATAVQLAKKLFGEQLNIQEGDARALPVPDNSIDFWFSCAALEHVPNVELAFAEIERVLAKGGIAVINAAWNCRPWTVKKLQQRPYTELSVADKLGKFFIPMREHLLFRMADSLPGRLFRELKLLEGSRVALEYSELEPDVSLWARYPHISDDDAFVSIDAHAALVYFASRRWNIVSHPTFMDRFGCRGEEIVVRKPEG